MSFNIEAHLAFKICFWGIIVICAAEHGHFVSIDVGVRDMAKIFYYGMHNLMPVNCKNGLKSPYYTVEYTFKFEYFLSHMRQ